MPANMETFGASEILWRNKEWVPFAFIEDTQGGLTNVFSVPYPIWVLNTTVISEQNPQYSNLRLVLCYADTGGIIEGEEILNPQTSYRIVQTSNTKMYLIIATGSIDRFRISPGNPKDVLRCVHAFATSEITGNGLTFLQKGIFNSCR